jgi:hypothetical protein
VTHPAAIVRRLTLGHLRCGIDAPAVQIDHTPMRDEPTPSGLPLTQAAEARLQAWQELRDKLQRLHAELEYLRLMMKMRKPG